MVEDGEDIPGRPSDPMYAQSVIFVKHHPLY